MSECAYGDCEYCGECRDVGCECPRCECGIVAEDCEDCQ